MSDQLLTVAALRTTVEAELIRSKLEKAGIASVLFEPEQPAEGAPPARVQVQVGQPDFERAMQLLFPIPQRPRPAKIDRPSWKCPSCGEQVMGQFPACWKCGTTREGLTAPGGVSFPSASAAGVGAPSLPPGRPAPPAPPMPAPTPASRFAASPPAPPLDAPPRLSMPGGAPPALEVPPIPPVTGVEPSAPARNGESPLKPGPVAASRTRTAEEDGLNIVVPAWDAAITKKGRQASGKPPTDADDRAARRAWWTAVLGIVCPPLLIYSIGVVMLLGLTGRELSSRGTRFFYGALAVNALIIGAAFTWLGMHR
ncbi:MAG TPA: hypothetical protein VG826_23090 [Pirellulales bacterium]|nr:hypothetical protein [Pirellulales bacterium]